MAAVSIKAHKNGPYEVSGAVDVVDFEAATYTVGEDPIYLCRCGQSRTKRCVTAPTRRSASRQPSASGYRGAADRRNALRLPDGAEGRERAPRARPARGLSARRAVTTFPELTDALARDLGASPRVLDAELAAIVLAQALTVADVPEALRQPRRGLVREMLRVIAELKRAYLARRTSTPSSPRCRADRGRRGSVPWAASTRPTSAARAPRRRRPPRARVDRMCGARGRSDAWRTATHARPRRAARLRGDIRLSVLQFLIATSLIRLVGDAELVAFAHARTSRRHASSTGPGTASSVTRRSPTRCCGVRRARRPPWSIAGRPARGLRLPSRRSRRSRTARFASSSRPTATASRDRGPRHPPPGAGRHRARALRAARARHAGVRRPHRGRLPPLPGAGVLPEGAAAACKRSREGVPQRAPLRERGIPARTSGALLASDYFARDDRGSSGRCARRVSVADDARPFAACLAHALARLERAAAGEERPERRDEAYAASRGAGARRRGARKNSDDAPRPRSGSSTLDQQASEFARATSPAGPRRARARPPAPA